MFGWTARPTPTAPTALGRVVGALGLVVVLLAGCGDGATGPVVPLVVVPEADRASLALEAADEADGGDKGAVQPVEHLKGPAAYARQEHVDAFLEACEALQPEGVQEAAERGTQYGEVWSGDNPAPDLGPIPEDGTFYFIEGNAEYMDPNLIAESAGSTLALQLFEGLMVYAAGNQPAKFGAAESATVSEDGLTWTFTLREGLTWSDGTPLTAEDYRYSWLRGLDPALGSRNAQQLWYIAGAQDYNTAKVDDPGSVGVRVVSPRVLEVDVRAPTPFFLDLVAYIAFAPVPRHVIEKHGKQWVRPENMVGNGAYTMAEWRPRDRMTFVKNERYWNAANVAVPRAVAYLTDDENRNKRLYESGEVHWARPLPLDYIRDGIQAGRADLHIDQEMCTYYYAINLNRPPFDDPLVRKAFARAIDKERLTKHVLASLQVATSNLVPDMFQQMLGYVPPKGDGFDAERAKAMLAKAGYPGGAGLPDIEIVYNTYEIHRQVAEFVQRNLSQNLGVEVTVSNMEWKSVLKEMRQGNFQVARSSWCKDYPDPMTFLTVFHSEAENNYPRYQNPVYDALLDAIGKETDTRKRNVMMCAAEKVLIRDQPIVPFYWYTRSYMLRPFVKGFEPQYGDDHIIKYLRLEP